MNRPVQLAEPQFLAMVGLAALAEREGELNKALTLQAILKHHPRCGPIALPWTLHHLEKLRAKVPPEQYEAVMHKAKHGKLSYDKVASGFIVGNELVDWLLAEFDTVEMAMRRS
jgi:hypothetical protein